MIGAIQPADFAEGTFQRAIPNAQVDPERVERQLQSFNREYDEITRALPSFGVGGSAMRDAVSFYNASIKTFPAINDFVIPLSEVLLVHPQVRLHQLSWHAVDDPRTVPSLSLAPPRNPPPVKSVARGGEAPVGPPASDRRTRRSTAATSCSPVTRGRR